MSETKWPNVGTVSSVGGTVESGYFNNTNTGINVTVPIESDTSLEGGTVEIISSKTESGTYEAFAQTPTEIDSSDLGGSITVLIDADTFKLFDQYGDGNTMFFNAIITDAAGNATTGTVSNDTIIVDDDSPSELSLIHI